MIQFRTLKSEKKTENYKKGRMLKTGRPESLQHEKSTFSLNTFLQANRDDLNISAEQPIIFFFDYDFCRVMLNPVRNRIGIHSVARF